MFIINLPGIFESIFTNMQSTLGKKLVLYLQTFIRKKIIIFFFSQLTFIISSMILTHPHVMSNKCVCSRFDFKRSMFFSSSLLLLIIPTEWRSLPIVSHNRDLVLKVSSVDENTYAGLNWIRLFVGKAASRVFKVDDFFVKRKVN